MNKKYNLLIAALLIPAASAQSSECIVQPTCAELGYTQTQTLCEAGNLPFIRCPFDKNAVFCSESGSSSAKWGLDYQKAVKITSLDYDLETNYNVLTAPGDGCFMHDGYDSYDMVLWPKDNPSFELEVPLKNGQYIWVNKGDKLGLKHHGVPDDFYVYFIPYK